MKEDFQVELLGIYSLEECLKKEKELAKTSLFPKGLNGNAGRYIAHTEEVKGKIREKAKSRVANGTHNFLEDGYQSRSVQIAIERGLHPFLGGEIQKRISKRRIEEGTHNFLGGEVSKKSNKERIENGTHNFLDDNFRKNLNEKNRKRVEDGTHHFCGPNMNAKRVSDGTHNFTREFSIQVQRKRVADGNHNFLGKHTVTALNIETGIISNIESDLYQSRKDLYLHPASKAFKEYMKDKKNGLPSC